jgi:hypothetical protein
MPALSRRDVDGGKQLLWLPFAGVAGPLAWLSAYARICLFFPVVSDLAVRPPLGGRVSSPAPAAAGSGER